MKERIFSYLKYPDYNIFSEWIKDKLYPNHHLPCLHNLCGQSYKALHPKVSLIINLIKTF